MDGKVRLYMDRHQQVKNTVTRAEMAIFANRRRPADLVLDRVIAILTRIVRDACGSCSAFVGSPSIPHAAHPARQIQEEVSSVEFDTKMIDRQVGRNAELFASSIAKLENPEERYPYIRILVSIIEQAHPEWSQAPKKDKQIAHLVHEMSADLDESEVADVVRVRDEERGYFYD